MGAIRSSSGAPEAVHLRRVRTNGDRPSGHETGPTPGGPLHLIPYAYPDLLREPNSRRFLTGLGVFVGLAVAAYTLAGVIGALVLSPVLRH
jgi:hypothetical protein